MPADPLWKLAVKVLVVAIVLNAFGIFAFYLSVAPIGTSFLIGPATLNIAFLFAAIVAIPAAFVLLIFQKYRKYSVRLLIAAVIYIPLTVGGLHTAFGVRRDGFIQLAQRSRPLVTAIRQFESKYGKPPDELSQLVPEFLGAVPKTGIGAYPNYEYFASPDKEIFRDNPWILKVDAQMGGLGWDQFLYFPKQNYPEAGYGGIIIRLEDWAYVNE